MKEYFILFVLLISSTFAQAQITIPQEEQKPKFSLELNAGFLGHHGLTADINLGVQLKKNTSLYLGVGSNGRYTQYLRVGAMREVISHNKFTLSMGAGLRFQHSDYSLIDGGIINSVMFEMPIQAEYLINERWSVNASLRFAYPLYQSSNEAFNQPNTGIQTQLSIDSVSVVKEKTKQLSQSTSESDGMSCQISIFLVNSVLSTLNSRNEC